ncbi:MAG: hypothetical protein KDB26_03405 [Microthrixaceae bacterium]|nr:hypothetical protein [Microthrixaceae bacterium]
MSPKVKSALPAERDWVSLDHDGDTYLFDLTFLRSNWTCIFAAGCKGIREEDTTEANEGCCTFGAHFSDGPDRKRVLAKAAMLTDEQWQFKGVAEDLGGPVIKADKKTWTTRVHDDACIFLNRNDFGRGPGCALHVGALDAGESFLDWKPEVCWQVPIRLSHHVDESGHTTWTMTDWKRRDWGGGGDYFHWWCTDTTEAFVGSVEVVESMRDEIVALVGDVVYKKLVEIIEAPRSARVDLPTRR